MTEFFNTNRAYFLKPPIPFQPFAQKLQVPSGSEVVFHGDFHGDIHSFIAMLDSLNQAGTLDGFRLAKPNRYMVFLGDYTDRGNYGIEVLYTLLRLKLANPDRVFMARGNHEDVQMTPTYGFIAECQKKYGTPIQPGADRAAVRFFPGGDLRWQRRGFSAVQPRRHGAGLPAGCACSMPSRRSRTNCLAK